MNTVHVAEESIFNFSGYVFGWVVFVISLTLFAFIIRRRYQILVAAGDDPRFASLVQRIRDLIAYGFIQKRQPRYFWAGILHMMIFWGFMVLGLRSMDLVTQGLGLPVLRPIMEGGFGKAYGSLKDAFELIVLIACVWAMLRRAFARPKRYEGSHKGEAYFVLGLISFLMVTDMFYEGSTLLKTKESGAWLPASHAVALFLQGVSLKTLETVYFFSYWIHILTFFFFLNFLPLGKHFHIITALPNIFLRKLSKGSIKPARWGVEDIEELETLGIEKYEDFTWKQTLDFFTCTECGRCSDMCPANAVGRPLSPKMLTLKLRDYGYERYPLFGSKKNTDETNHAEIAGDIITSEEIWSCTTCGACEEECPVFIEYIDKIIDMRRRLIETSRNPHTFNQVLMNLEKTGNPFGKPAAKRADWIDELVDVPVKILQEGDEVDVLFFVDSFGSYDPAVQSIATDIAKGFHMAGVEFGILGPMEVDSGHQVRRMGEEGLFQFLVETNVETFQSIRFNKIVTTDPHAFNTLKNDYPLSFEVQHYATFFLSLVDSGHLKPSKPVGENVYTYHDPCYLGRHNEIYDAPRRLLQSLPGLKYVEMERSRDRSFCCGGGDIILWHEIEQEEIRMAEKRIIMAEEAGANAIVTACPFCLIHFEDAVKTAGLEGKMKIVDLMTLFLSTL